MKETYPIARMPLILRYHRLMDVFAKSDDERDFYLDRVEGFLVFVDLEKGEEEIRILEKEIDAHKDRYCLIPKMTFFEIKKFMEGFIQEKVYDIDTKEKLLDLIGAKEARENFLEFIYDQLTELEKWQVYYQERSRVRIIEWLRQQQIQFVFEEDLDFNKNLVEKLKKTLFEAKVPKDLMQARELLFIKSKTYYSNEALNPRPKRGRPPKQVAKVASEPQFTMDVYTTVPMCARHFLYMPEIYSAASVTFSGKFETEQDLLNSLRGSSRIKVDEKLEALSQRLESLQSLSHKLAKVEKIPELEHVTRVLKSSKTKFTESKDIEFGSKEKDLKVEQAVQEVLPKKRGRPLKEDVTFVPQKKKRFVIKKVTPISSSKKNKK